MIIIFLEIFFRNFFPRPSRSGGQTRSKIDDYYFFGIFFEIFLLVLVAAEDKPGAKLMIIFFLQFFSPDFFPHPTTDGP